jgi:hypothetical protein
MRILAALMLLMTSFSGTATNSTDFIRPGDPWNDLDGKRIQAHSVGITKVGDQYYWFGEDRTQGLDPSFRYVSCYVSTDLIRWKFIGRPLQLASVEGYTGHWVLERPKVYHDVNRKRFVMYFHLDDEKYKAARVGVAVSDKITGPYRYVNSFRPLGDESRDIGQFVDDDGTPYLIFEDRPSGGFHIASLSPDYFSVENEVSFIHVPLEGGAIVHYDGLYYVLGSHLSGWNPNPNVYASAKSLAGPWTELSDIAPPETKTYLSQSSFLLKIVGTKKTTVLYMGDRWKPDELWDSRYIWMPLEIGGGKMRLPEPKPFHINVHTGEFQLEKP